MVTVPEIQNESTLQQQQQTPNVIVLGEMTMTTNNTDEEEKAPQRELRESCLVNVEDGLDTTQCLIRRRPNSSCGSSSKGAETRIKQIEKHVTRMSMSKLKKEFD